MNLPLVLVVLASAALSQSQVDADLIAEARHRSNKAIAAHDLDGILAEIDSSFHVTAGSGRFITGRAEMGEAFEVQFSQFTDVLYIRTPDTIEVSRSGERAFESGNWVGTWTTDEDPLLTGGSYAASWSKESGAWKIRSEVFVTLYCEGKSCS